MFVRFAAADCAEFAEFAEALAGAVPLLFGGLVAVGEAGQFDLAFDEVLPEPRFFVLPIGEFVLKNGDDFL